MRKKEIFVKNVLLRITFGIAVVLYACEDNQPSVIINALKVDAPFDMPAIKIPDFSNSERILITDFGAAQGNKKKNSKAIEQAINKANRIGGGVVIIPEGEWLTGKIHLKSNVNLHLDKGAVLVFSGNPEDYLPPVPTSWEGMECYNYSPLLYAYNCQNIAITGDGKLTARMETWEKWFSRPPRPYEQP